MSVLTSINPSDRKVLGTVDVSTKQDVINAVAKARKASIEWGSMSVDKRIELLSALKSIFEENKREIAKIASSEMGFNIRDELMFDVEDGFNYFNWYLENAPKILAPSTTLSSDSEVHQIYYEPYGVAAVIQPWDFPFSQFVWSVIPNLVAGNTVVFKHSEKIPLSAKLFEKLVAESPLPDGVVNFVYGAGEVGKTLIEQDVDLIAFTGSVDTGRLVYESGAKRLVKVVLELGGSAPGVVCKDANLETAASHIVDIRFLNNGQVCDGLKRLILHESLFDELVTKLKERVEAMKIGDPLDETTNLGPIVDESQLKKLEAQVADALDKGAKVVTGGRRLDNLGGYFYAPTILTNINRKMRVWKEEVFGPVLPVVSFKTYEEAVRLANDTEFGLGAYVYTSDIELGEKLAKEIKSGMVSINGTNYVCPFNPFGGSKSSGVGREHGEFGLRELTQVKVIVRPV